VTGRSQGSSHPPGWLCRAAEADRKQEASWLLAADNGLSLSATVCGGLAWLGFMSKRSGCNDARSALDGDASGISRGSLSGPAGDLIGAARRLLTGGDLIDASRYLILTGSDPVDALPLGMDVAQHLGELVLIGDRGG
jgi:hypothetical protein